jgi:hypothetical protein
VKALDRGTGMGMKRGREEGGRDDGMNGEGRR